MAAAPSLAGQSIYIVLRARLNATTTGLELSVQTDEHRLVGSTLAADNHPISAVGKSALGWQLFSFQATLGWSGHVQFGVRAYAKKAGAPTGSASTSSRAMKDTAAAAVQVDYAGIVLAQIGSEWGRMLL